MLEVTSKEAVNALYYTNKTTRIIHEAQFVDDYVIVRPLLNALAKDIRRLPASSFEDEFDEFYGVVQEVTDYLMTIEGGKGEEGSGPTPSQRTHPPA